MCTYTELRYAVRANDVLQVDKIWQAMFPLFKATNKHKYSFLSIYSRFVVKYAHQSIKDVVQSCMVSLHGFANQYIGPDTITEKINLEGR